MTFLGFTNRGGSEGYAAPAVGVSASRAREAVGLVVLGWIGVIALFHGTAFSMVQTWYESSTFNHGFLIFPIVGFLLWERRAWLMHFPPRPAILGLAALAGGALLWLVGEFAHVLIVREVALVVMLQAMWLTVLGWRLTWVAIFPLAYLFFAVPFGFALVQPLQDFTAGFATHALQLIGIPVLKEGVFLSTPTGVFEVAEACAGLRFLIAMLALGVLFASMAYRTWWRRFFFLGLCFVVPIIANGIRAFSIVYIAYLSDNELAVGVDHIIYGWIFFSMVMLTLLGLGLTFQDRPIFGQVEPPDPGEGLSPKRPPANAALIGSAVAGLIIAAGAPAFAAHVAASTPQHVAVTLAPPNVASPWRLVKNPGEIWRAHFAKVDAELAETYEETAPSGATNTVHLYVGYYAHQRQGAELVAYGNELADGHTWQRAGTGTKVATVEGRRITVGTTDLLANGLHPRRAWYWYWVDGQITTNPYIAKLLEIRGLFLNGRRDAAVVAVASDVVGSVAATDAILQDFSNHLHLLGSTLAPEVAADAAAAKAP